MTNKYGLIGGKLGHSLSPAIHQLFFEYTGKQGSYELLESELEELPEPLAALALFMKLVNQSLFSCAATSV